MIDNDQITALAREYAEERASLMQGSLSTKIQAELVIRFLIRRFCLVEKSKVMEIYEKEKRMEKMAGVLHKPLMGLWFKAGLKLLEDFFPEIVKEVKE